MKKIEFKLGNVGIGITVSILLTIGFFMGRHFTHVAYCTF